MSKYNRTSKPGGITSPSRSSVHLESSVNSFSDNSKMLSQKMRFKMLQRMKRRNTVEINDANFEQKCIEVTKRVLDQQEKEDQMLKDKISVTNSMTKQELLKSLKVIENKEKKVDEMQGEQNE